MFQPQLVFLKLNANARQTKNTLTPYGPNTKFDVKCDMRVNSTVGSVLFTKSTERSLQEHGR